MSVAADKLSASCRLLLLAHDTAGWWPARSRFEVIVGAVLVQNTRWVNAANAIRELRRLRLLSLSAILATSDARLQAAIRSAGCQRIKARRLRAVASGLHEAGGLAVLARWETCRLRSYLRGIHGIGEETADAILVYAFGRRAFIADAYARRWLARMGLWAAESGPAGYRRCKSMMEERLGWDSAGFRDLHAAIVLHAQHYCRLQPECGACIVREDCRYGAIQSAAALSERTGASTL